MGNMDLELRREAEAARRLISGLQELQGDDDLQLRHDMVEGETGLVEVVAQALGEINECNIMITGIREQESWLGERRERLTRRKETLSALVEQAMLSTELTSLRLPGATLSVVRRPRSLEIVQEADIPARFWVLPEPPAPRLDRKALLAALNDAQDVPGAILGDVTYSLTVRRK